MLDDSRYLGSNTGSATLNFPVIVQSSSESDTEAVGAMLAALAQPGDVIGLVGPLGAGKTVLVRGILRALGGDASAVRSPTFTLMNMYSAKLPIYHFDFYRLSSDMDLDSIGFYEFACANGISLVEWADRIPDVLADCDWLVKIELLPDPHDRRVVIEKGKTR